MGCSEISKKSVLLSILGNAIEWCDYTLYSAFGLILSASFLSDKNDANGMFKIFAVFATGYLARPIGGVVFGLIGDKYGRPKSMILSVGVMAIGTILIGCLPPKSIIGIFAEVLLIFSRLLQGFALGGEFSVSSVYIVENASEGKKAFYGSFSMTSLAIGIFAGNTIFLLSMFVFGAEALHSFAWRIPIIFSGIFAGCVAFLRRNLVEAKQASVSHQNVSTKLSLKNILLGCGVAIGDGIPFYIFAIFFRTMLERTLNYTAVQSTLIGMLIIFSYGVSTIVSGFLADKITERRMILLGAFFIILGCFPVISFYQNGSHGWLSISCVSLFIGWCIGMYHGALPSFFVKLFSTTTKRATSISISYNLAMVFGSTAPMVCSVIIMYFSTKWAALVGCYAIGSLVVASISVLLSPVGSSSNISLSKISEIEAD